MNLRARDAALAARLILVPAALLLLNVHTVVAQTASNSTTSTTAPHATNGINFDFTSAAVASFVLVLLGLTAVLVILARLLSGARIS